MLLLQNVERNVALISRNALQASEAMIRGGRRCCADADLGAPFYFGRSHSRLLFFSRLYAIQRTGTFRREMTQNETGISAEWRACSREAAGPQ